MKILLVHNSYQQPGGEDVAFNQERQLLERAGHQVLIYSRSNWEIAGHSALKLLALAGRVTWARDSRREIASLLYRQKPDLVHVHNTFLMVSPSIYSACREAHVPVVQTLHNYRLLCPAAIFFRRGSVCEECLEHSLWRGVLHGCYRDSRAETSAVALMLGLHRWLGTWTWGVNRFIVLTGFSRQKFIEGGIPAEKIALKPNFVYPDPLKGDQGSQVRRDETEVRSEKHREAEAQSVIGNHQSPMGVYALFIGRLSPEKNVATLLAAWQRLQVRIPLRIIGGGPERVPLEARAKKMELSEVRFLGHLPREEVIGALKGALFLLFSSEWYENFPVTIVEAFACGVPVICSRLGAMEGIVADGRTGLHFTPSNADDLAAKVEWAWSHPEEMAAMGRAARAEFEAKYTAERNYQMLMEIYRKVLGARGQGPGARGLGG
jgi:glycosyltransferase involved in cell wall biosynthesis